MTVVSKSDNLKGWPWQFFEISGAILLALDSEGRVSYINQKGAETLGHPVQDILGKDWFENFLPQRIRAEVRKVFRQHQSGAANAPERFENLVLCRDGSERIIAWRNAAVRDASGKVVVGLSSGEDVTERRRAQAELRDNERRFRATFEQAAVGMAHVDLDGRFLRLNGKLCEITGYSRAELEQLTFADITHPDDLDLDLLQVQLLRAGRIPHYTREKRYIRKDGSVTWVHLTVSLVRDEQGRPEYFSGVVEDVGLQKQAEELLADEELQRLALSAADAGAWRWEATTGRLNWTSKTHEIFGLDPAAATPTFALWLGRCIHHEDRPRVVRTLLKAVATGGADFRIEFRCIHPAGAVRWVAAMGRVQCQDAIRPALAYGIVHDVTARRAIDEEHRENEARLQLAMRAGRIGVWDWDVPSGEVSWSSNLAGFLGMDPDATPRNVDEWRALVHPEDRERVESALERALADQAEYDIEFRMTAPDGRALWRGAHGAVIRDASGRPRRMIGIDMDVGERKSEEERQRLLTGELDHRTRNLLTVVHMIARQSLAAGPDRDDFLGRLGALGKAHSVLVAPGHGRKKLTEILAQELVPFPTSRVMLNGPDVSVAPRTAQMLVLMLHELTTNAVKYGALSWPAGKLSVEWSVNPQPAEWLDLRWTERGGPPVLPPAREGFGTHMLQRCAKTAGGRIELSYAPEGLQVHLGVPVARAGMND